tara:strand:- start:2727 stop:3128 length:402 start_codon:yes stop_codon:yes gene_type:complete
MKPTPPPDNPSAFPAPADFVSVPMSVHRSELLECVRVGRPIRRIIHPTKGTFVRIMGFPLHKHALGFGYDSEALWCKLDPDNKREAWVDELPSFCDVVMRGDKIQFEAPVAPSPLATYVKTIGQGDDAPAEEW